MKFTTNIADIDFDGSKVWKAERDGADFSISIHNCTLMDNHPASTDIKDKIELLIINFHSTTEEKANLFKGKGESEVISHFPPLDAIENFGEENGKYKFSGYLNNVPWAVWEFKASNYVISW